MRVLVDTSVWADFLNGHSSEAADRLAAYISAETDLAMCGLVLTEVLQGLRDGAAVRRVEARFRDLDYLVPSEPDTYIGAAALFRALRRQGVTIRSAVDCLIAQLAFENGCAILAKDSDFEAIVRSGLRDLPALPAVDEAAED